MNNIGKLFIVSTPIGNPGDITLRAIEILRAVDAVICEEPRQGSTLLKRLEIIKELIPVNEHNEKEQVSNLVYRLVQGQNFALISDCGTPVFSDPGVSLIEQATQFGVQVVPVPGASSLMATISILDVKLNNFYFAGFLSRQPKERRTELQKLRGMKVPVILMDAPYRMISLLDDIQKTFGKGQKVTLACDLTLPSEKIFRGHIGEIRNQIGQKKAEFILVLH